MLRIYTITLLLLCLHLAGQAQDDRQWLRKGNKAYNKADYNKAEENYKKALSKNPANHRATYNLGCVAMMRQMQQNADSIAIDYFVKAAHGQTDKTLKAQAFHNIGIIHQQHENYESAIDAYKHTLRLTPHNFIARYNLELCKQLLKKQQQQQNKQNQSSDNNKQDNKQQQKDDKQQQKDDKQQQNKNDQSSSGDNGDKNRQQSHNQKGQMSKDNAQQMLNAAMQEEKKTQQRLQRSKSKGGTRSNEKNW